MQENIIHTHYVTYSLLVLERNRYTHVYNKIIMLIIIEHSAKTLIFKF